MTRKPVLRRRSADDDIESAIAFYLEEAGGEVAVEFVNQLENVLVGISRHPAAGSSRYGLEPRIPGLRTWVMTSFPYLIFYLVKEARIEIVRVLHNSMDIPSRLDDEE